LVRTRRFLPFSSDHLQLSLSLQRDGFAGAFPSPRKLPPSGIRGPPPFSQKEEAPIIRPPPSLPTAEGNRPLKRSAYASPSEKGKTLEVRTKCPNHMGLLFSIFTSKTLIPSFSQARSWSDFCSCLYFSPLPFIKRKQSFFSSFFFLTRLGVHFFAGRARYTSLLFLSFRSVDMKIFFAVLCGASSSLSFFERDARRGFLFPLMRTGTPLERKRPPPFPCAVCENALGLLPPPFYRSYPWRSPLLFFLNSRQDEPFPHYLTGVLLFPRSVTLLPVEKGIRDPHFFLMLAKFSQPPLSSLRWGVFSLLQKETAFFFPPPGTVTPSLRAGLNDRLPTPPKK